MHKPDLEKEYIYWYNRATKAEELLASSTEEKFKLQSRLASQEKVVRKAQETALALRASDNSQAEDDDVIRAKLQGIRGQWKIFAKDWAVKHLPSIRETESRAEEMFARLVEADEKESRDGLWTLQNASKYPSILLNAELARFVGKEIISEPFISAFAYDSEINANVNEPWSTMGSLNVLYGLNKLRKVDNGMQARIPYDLHS